MAITGSKAIPHVNTECIPSICDQNNFYSSGSFHHNNFQKGFDSPQVISFPFSEEERKGCGALVSGDLREMLRIYRYQDNVI